jgi:superfamily II DNA or RNA helicase
VRVRRHAWIVQGIDTYDACRVLTLRRHNPDGAPIVRHIIEPFDDVELVAARADPVRIGLRAWRRRCQVMLARDGPATAFRCAAAARIELLPYQFEPTLALLRGLGSRLLIADDVGLGKTVQAMLAIAELRARGAIARVLIVCPAGLREQWADECAERFGLPAAVMDPPGIRRVRASTAASVNPWLTQTVAIASVDYVKRPEVLPSVLDAGWDLIAIDEAHGACGDSDRHAALAELACRAGYVLLLTATPHNGNERAFASLCATGQIHDDPLLVFRRSRIDVARAAGRRTHRLRVVPTPAEKRMHASLARLTAAARRDAGGPGQSALLVLSLLHKRAFSSAFALSASVERRLAMLGERGADAGRQQLFLPLDAGSGEEDGGDAPPMWHTPVLRNETDERALLTDLLNAARQAIGCESKLHRLRRLIARVREPVIVFTEYRDTLLHVRQHLGRAAVVVHGGMSRSERHEALARFGSVGLLLATDAAGEGLNLQRHCRAVVNLELPWNPMRLEQRVGRVDRIGQTRGVHAFHLIGAGTREIDLLDRLDRRVQHARARVGAPDPLSCRPEWTEESSARLVVLRESTTECESEPMSLPHVAVMRLVADGERAFARSSLARRLTGRLANASAAAPDADPDHHRSAAIAVSGRRQLRLALGGRALVLFESTLADAAGRRVASRVEPDGHSVHE